MKKSTLLVSMLVLGAAAFGQSQRLVLAEEFTQASCGPCAAQNPTFNTLLAANTAKVVSIKYQTSWPGVDPMNAQNTTDVATRVSYYGVSGVPDSPMDGVEQTGGSYTGAPANYTQAKIDAEYAVPSPFTINLTHSFSPDYDSIFINCVITASQAFTSTGALKARIGMVEQTIHFATAPGTNGETDFYNVMRKMYPSPAGTTLPTTWTSGQSQTITIGAPIPAYVYSKAQIGVVAFVQDDGNKSVKQAGYSVPQSIAVDAGTTAITGIPLYQCTTTFTPTITVKNFGTSTLTSCTINYKLDAGTVITQPWTGSLATNATSVVTLPAQTVTTGLHTFTGYTSEPNGLVDPDAANNQTVKTFSIIGTGAPAPLVEGYQTAAFPPTGWFLNNVDNGPTWTRKTGSGGFGTSSACAKVDFYNSPAGQVDELFTKNLDLSSGGSSTNLTFDVAYATYSGQNDKIEVKVSSDCGATWATLYNKAGATLSTAPATTSVFAPTAAQWRTETVNLNSYVGQSNVMIKFVATSAYGNNAYIDNININSFTTGITEQAAAGNVNVYPNPMSNNATVSLTLTESSPVGVVLVNSIGQVVLSENLGTMSAGEQSYLLNVESLSNGLYFLNVTVGEHVITKKVSINK